MVEVFVVDQKVEQIFALEFVEYELSLVAHVVGVDHFLHLIQSSKPPLEIAVNDQIDNQFQAFLFLVILG